MVAHQVAIGTGVTVDADIEHSHHYALHHHGLHHYTNLDSGQTETNLDNLYPALVQCFGIILLGFIAGKFSIISDVEAKGLGTFIGTFSLPALIFVSFLPD